METTCKKNNHTGKTKTSSIFISSLHILLLFKNVVISLLSGSHDMLKTRVFGNHFSIEDYLLQKIISHLRFEKQFFIYTNVTTALTLFRMGFFGAAHKWGGPFCPLLPKIRHTYPAMMKLGTVIPYLWKIQKMYKSRDTSLEFC